MKTILNPCLVTKTSNQTQNDRKLNSISSLVILKKIKYINAYFDKINVLFISMEKSLFSSFFLPF